MRPADDPRGDFSGSPTWKPTHDCRHSLGPHVCPFCARIATGVNMELHIRQHHLAEALDHLATEREQNALVAAEVTALLDLQLGRDSTTEERSHQERLRALLGIEIDDVDSAEATIWTDGCCLKNPGGNGGWGYVVTADGDAVGFGKGGEVNSTNNRMELMAVIAALELHTDSFERIEIVSDSRYVVDGLNDWMPNWKRNGWTRKAGRRREEVKNIGLWKRLDEMFDRERMTIRWTKGHAGDAFNEQADQLAMVGARSVE